MYEQCPTIPPLTGTITIDVPVARAFRVFTDASGSRWPAGDHIGQALRDGVTGGGWSRLLELFAKATSDQT